MNLYNKIVASIAVKRKRVYLCTYHLWGSLSAHHSFVTPNIFSRNPFWLHLQISPVTLCSHNAGLEWNQSNHQLVIIFCFHVNLPMPFSAAVPIQLTESCKVTSLVFMKCRTYAEGQMPQGTGRMMEYLLLCDLVSLSIK
jgi:hypothetical protein